MSSLEWGLGILIIVAASFAGAGWAMYFTERKLRSSNEIDKQSKCASIVTGPNNKPKGEKDTT